MYLKKSKTKIFKKITELNKNVFLVYNISFKM